MTHNPLAKSAAPSSTLLKYLRAQSQGQPFFSANHAPHHGARAITPSPGAHAGLSLFRRLRSSSRSMATFAPILEASLLPQLNSLFSSRLFTSSASLTEGDVSSNSHLYPKTRPTYCTTPSARSLRSAHTAANGSASEGWSSIKGWRRYLDSSKKKASTTSGSNLQPDDIPPLTGFLDDSPSLGRVVPRLNELRLRCTEFDEHGEVMMTNREFRKSELIAKVCFTHSSKPCRETTVLRAHHHSTIRNLTNISSTASHPAISAKSTLPSSPQS